MNVETFQNFICRQDLKDIAVYDSELIGPQGKFCIIRGNCITIIFKDLH